MVTSKIFFLGLLFSISLFAAIHGNPQAVKGGTFTIGVPSYPKSLFYYLSTDEQSELIDSLVFETLVDRDPVTYEFVPLLAEKWTVSPDKKTFTFTLNEKAKFSDDTPVTSADVKFTFDALRDPKHKTITFQSLLKSFDSCTEIDARTVQFKANNIHFKNFEIISGLYILPKHFFSKGDFNKGFHTKLLGSGPYQVDSVKQGEKVILKRNPKFWGKDLEENTGRYNFDRLVFKSITDINVMYEVFKKGDIDYYYFVSAKMWSTETNSFHYEKKYIKKIKGDNGLSPATQGIVWNLRKPIFQDKRVRKALSHLMNRERWIKELFYNNYVPATGIVSSTSEFHSPKNKPLLYNPEEAKKLLKEAGWVMGGRGVLEKDKQAFEIEILTDNASSQRHLTLYQEDLKKAGIKITIRTVDWATGIKLTDDRQFDGREQARSRDIDPGTFCLSWGSSEADVKGSANVAGFKNSEVDELCKKIDETFEKSKRIPLIQRLDEIIGEEQPLSFAWEANFFRIAHWNRYSYPDKGYFKYSSWRSAFHYWWLDNAKKAALEKALLAKTALPE